MPVRVANIRKLHRVDGETRVYVGRACNGYQASPLANPFRSKDLPGGKTEAISMYRVWLRAQLLDSSTEATREVLRLAEMASRGEHVVLMCWCHPAECHGDVLVDVINRVSSRMVQGAR